MPILILIPLACFVLCAALMRPLLGRHGLGGDWPAALIVAALLVGVFVVACTELLSLLGLLAFWPVVAVWLVLLAGLLLARRRRWGLSEPLEEESWLPGWCGWRSWGAWCWVAAGLIVLLALVVAMASPPNTHDALSYHLPRQVRWMQMGQVRHYATDDMRELSFPPFAEFVQMHTLLLTASDAFVHLPQWGAYALTVLASALTCRALGRAWAAPLAALLVACQPMAYIQAASPKNDPVLMFLMVVFGWLAAAALVRGRCGLMHCLLMGAALGLAALTKSTATVLMLPVCLLVGVVLLYQHRAGALWRGTIIAIVAAVLVAGHTTRNIQAFGHPMGPLNYEDGGFSLSMERHDVAGIGSNMLRNLALHVVLNSTEQVARVEGVVRAWHERLGWDPDDPQTTWGGGYVGQVALNNEGRVPAPIHVVLVVVCLPLLLLALRRRDRGDWAASAFWACGVASFVLFVSLVKWNPWHARLHAPIIAFLAAPTAIGLARARGGAWAAATGLAIGAPVLAFLAWAAVVNVDRPLHGPRGVLLNPQQDITRWRSDVAHRAGMQAVEGLWRAPTGPVSVLAGDEEYNVLHLMKSIPGRRPLTHIYASLGRTQAKDPLWSPPVAIITVYHAMPVRAFGDRVYERVSELSSLNLYVLRPSLPPRRPGESMATLTRYAALPEPMAHGRMAPQHAGWRTAHGLALPARGLGIPVPGDGQPRTLLVAIKPIAHPSTSVIYSIGERVLHVEPTLTSEAYTIAEIAVPGLEKPGVLHVTFPEAQANGAADAVAVGWLQMPTNVELAAYDASITEIATSLPSAQ